MADETKVISPSAPATSSNTVSQAGANDDAKDATLESSQGGEDADQPAFLEVTDTNGKVEDDGNKMADDETGEAAQEDIELKEAGDADDVPESSSLPAATAVNGTPAASKKASNGSNKKKSSGIPEHKSKKLSRKKSKPALTHLDAMPGDFYMAQMKGHPSWPSVICDEEMLPHSLLISRPVTTRQPDGTFKKPDYEDGGKKAHERTFPVMFLYTNEFAWVPNTSLTDLDLNTCENVEEKGKSKQLYAAFKVAAEKHDLAYFKQLLDEHQKAMQDDEDAKIEREAKKAGKQKRKSGAATAQAEKVDEMDMDEDVEEEKPKAKKRKKSLADDGGDEKSAKTPKTSTKLKLSTPKTPAAESSSKKKITKSKGKKAVQVDDDDGDDDDSEMIDNPRVEEKPLTPAEARLKKEKEVLYCRHKLQRGFLSRDTMPKEEEMKSMSDFLTKLEGLPDLEATIIRTTKIHKVLKGMIKLASIPKDEEYKFKVRSVELFAKWSKILSDDGGASGAADKDEDSKMEDVKPQSEAAASNGVDKEEKADASDAAAPEEENAENNIGTTVEGEKETEKEAETEEVVAGGKGDEPDIEDAAEEAYQPPTETAEVTA